MSMSPGLTIRDVTIEVPHKVRHVMSGGLLDPKLFGIVFRYFQSSAGVAVTPTATRSGVNGN